MKRAVKLVGIVLGGVAVVVLLLIGGVYGFSSSQFGRSYEISPPPLQPTVEMSADELVARGRHVAVTRGCADCHGEDVGGKGFVDDGAFGLLWASNLTRGEGGVASSYSDQDWDRAIRHGVGPDGKPLLFMPAQEFWVMGDDDIAALIAYFRAAEPVDRVIPEPKAGPLARALFVAGQLPLVPAKLIDHEARRPSAPEPGATVEYGAYLATGCTGCHGAGYSGGKIVGGDPSWPPAANLTPDPETGLGAWTEADFATALREGVRPDGTEIDPVMPIAATKHMTDEEVQALWAFLRTLEPKAAGNR